MLTDDMYDLLFSFYQWERENNPSDIGYPHQTPERRLMGSAVGSIGLSDDEAMDIDRALCALKAEHPDEHYVLVRVHQHGRSLRWMEHRGDGNRKNLKTKLESAHHFIRGRLSLAREIENA